MDGGTITLDKIELIAFVECKNANDKINNLFQINETIFFTKLDSKLDSKVLYNFPLRKQLPIKPFQCCTI